MKANCTFLEVMMVKEITAAFVFLTRGEIAGSNKLSLVGLLHKGEMDTLQL